LAQVGFVAMLPNYRHYEKVKLAGFMDDALYPEISHADTVTALSIPARGRAPTLADIAAFVKPAVSRQQSS
jgi:hypothetical protein